MKPDAARRPRLAIALLVGVLALLLGACGGAATPRPAAPQQVGGGRAECGGAPPEDVTADRASPVALLDAIGTARSPVTYVFVIDSSGSMKDADRYGQVRREIRAFLRALCPDDQVAAITFADRAETTLSLTPLRDATDLPNRLPNPNGRNTDIGAGIARALDEVEGAPAGRQTAVVLFTDGDHQPPKNSSYPESTGPPWDTLRERAEAAGAQRPLHAYSVPLVGSSGTELLASVFDQTRDLVAEGPAPLAEVLGRAQQQARLEQAAPLLDSEVGTGVAVEWPNLSDTNLSAEDLVIDLRLRNTSGVFPATVDGLSLESSGDFSVIADPLPRTLSLAASETMVVPVHVRWTEPRRGGLVPGEGNYSSDLTVGGTVTSHTAEGLARLLDRSSTPTDPDLQEPSASLSGTAPVVLGIGLWAALLALVVVGLTVGRWLRPAIPGQLLLFAEEPDEERAPPVVGTIAINGRRSVRVRSEDGSQALDVPGFDARVQVSGRRRFPDGAVVARTRVTLIPRDKPFESRRAGRHDLPLGRRRLVVGLDIQHRDNRSESDGATAATAARY